MKAARTRTFRCASFMPAPPGAQRSPAVGLWGELASASLISQAQSTILGTVSSVGQSIANFGALGGFEPLQNLGSGFAARTRIADTASGRA